MTRRRVRRPPEDGTGDSDPGVWTRKGATLSDGTACREFGLTREGILEAINRGRLQYRLGSCHGNPFLRLLRREVEALVQGKRGGRFLEDRKARAKLARTERELRALHRRVAALEKERARILAGMGK